MSLLLDFQTRPCIVACHVKLRLSEPLCTLVCSEALVDGGMVVAGAAGNIRNLRKAIRCYGMLGEVGYVRLG